MCKPDHHDKAGRLRFLIMADELDAGLQSRATVDLELPEHRLKHCNFYRNKPGPD
jgi:hypothetical protein